MLLIKAENIKKSYGEREIISFEELAIYEKDKIGLVGLNGAGKTTLLNILAGEINPDEGKIQRYCEISYFKQFDSAKVTSSRQLLKELNVLEESNRDNVSGGENTRLRLASVLSKDKHIHFFDEPTSNLDLRGIELLKSKLSKLDTLIIISHDRDLLDSICSKIIEVRENRLFFYDGNYSKYEMQRQENYERKLSEYENYINEKGRLLKIYKDKMDKAGKIGSRPKNMSPSECNLRDFLASRPSGVKQKNMQDSAKAVLSRINHLEVKEKPKEIPDIKLDFTLTNPPENKIVIEGKDILFSYGSKTIFKKSEFNVYNKQHLAIVGDNGAGKTTLLNLIKDGYKGIRIVPKASIGYFHQDFKNINLSKTVLQNAMEDSIQKENVVRTILARLLFKNDDINKEASVLSGGELIKLSFAKLFVSSANILMLDEPTNYLDIPSVIALKELFVNYEGTLIFVSHDKKFINEIATDLLIIKDNTVKSFHGNYDEFENSLNKSKDNGFNEALISSAEMKITAILSRFSNPKEDKKALDKEYKEALFALNKLKNRV